MGATRQVTDMPLHTLRVESQGKLVATGAADGSTTLFEICAGLCVAQTNEKASISQMLEREVTPPRRPRRPPRDGHVSSPSSGRPLGAPPCAATGASSVACLARASTGMGQPAQWLSSRRAFGHYGLLVLFSDHKLTHV